MHGTLLQLAPRPHPKVMPPYLRELTMKVCEEFGVSVEDVMGPSRKHVLSDARRKIWATAYARNHCAYTTTSLGRWFNRDHSTILVGIARHGRKRIHTWHRREFLGFPRSFLDEVNAIGYLMPTKAIAVCLECSPKQVARAREQLRREGAWHHVWSLQRLPNGRMSGFGMINAGNASQPT